MIVVLMPSFQYSGLLSPVEALGGGARAIARVFPTTYYLDVSVGVLAKHRALGTFASDILVLTAFAIGMTLLGRLLIRKQQR
jgi:ribosome-dependent ATPase